MSPKLTPVACCASAFLAFQLVGLLAPKQEPTSQVNAATNTPHPTTALKPSRHPQSPEPLQTLNHDPVGTQQGSLKELAASFEASKSPAEARLALMEAINKLKPDDLAQMLAKEAGNTDFYRSSRFDFQFAARRLSEIAPEKAAALWLSTKSSHYSVDVLLLPWAQRDPQAFASWSRTLPADAQKAMAGTLGQLVSENPAALTPIAAQLAQNPAGVVGARSAISGMIAKAQKGSDPADAIAYASALPAGPMRTAALAELARWPGLDLATHPEIADALASVSPSEMRRYIPQAAASAEKLPPGYVREAAFSTQISGIARKDPAAAAKKVESLSGTADYPAAVRGFVEATASKDPVAALEWALTINTQGNQRTAALEKAAAEYFRTKPADARKWVETAPLTPAEYAVLTGRSR